jgi:pimeloyl-ACP methyl ester carboxylesterase
VRTELVAIPGDGEDLDGAWYLPDGEPVGAVLLLHGNTMNFYTGPPRFLPPALTARGFACLAFNRRGHDVLTTTDSRAARGGALQTAAEGLADTVSAAAWVAGRGHPEPFLIGHSNGGMLAVAHAAAHPEVRGLVLLSAHLGGPGIFAAQAAAGQLTADRTDEYVDRAERLVAEGRGDELLLLPGWWYVMSATSLLDRLRATPDVLALAPRVRCPSLFIRGLEEDPAVYPAERFADLTAGQGEIMVLPGCDHFYRGQEQRTATLVGDWLAAKAEG